MSARSLRGRAALVTGVSRRQGIGFAIASRLVRSGEFPTQKAPTDRCAPMCRDGYKWRNVVEFRFND